MNIMRRYVYFITLFSFLTVCTNSLWAKSFDGPGGHAYDFRHVLEGCTGDELEDLYKKISGGIDREFYDIVRKKWKISGNHRIIGHWGFESRIPYNVEPWKSALAGIPQDQMAALWQSYTKELVDAAIIKTGLPRQQARGLVGLLYNVHLLGDRVYGNSVTSSVMKPDFIIQDIEKNLRRLFGNNSTLVKAVSNEIKNIPGNAVYASKCNKVIEILYSHEIGEKFYSTYRAQLSKHQIKYIDTIAGKMMRKATAPATKTAGAGSHELAKAFSKYVRGHTGRTAFNGRIGQKSLYSPKSVSCVRGVLQRVSVNGKNALVLSVPVNMAKAGLKAGVYSGIATFVFAEGYTIYNFARGEITEDEFLRQSVKNLGVALAVGAATFVCVALGATPYGWVVAGVCIATAIIVDLVFEHLYKEFKTPIITMDDILGQLPTELQRRPNIFDKTGFEYINKENRKGLELYEKYYHDGILAIPDRENIVGPMSGRKTIIYDINE